MFHQTTHTTHEEEEAEAEDNSTNNKKKVWQIQCMHKPTVQRRQREPKQLRQQLKQAAARTGNKLKAKATTTSATPSTTTATRATLSAYKCQRGSALLP